MAGEVDPLEHPASSPARATTDATRLARVFIVVPSLLLPAVMPLWICEIQAHKCTLARKLRSDRLAGHKKYPTVWL
jgi:hypothetical protein